MGLYTNHLHVASVGEFNIISIDQDVGSLGISMNPVLPQSGSDSSLPAMLPLKSENFKLCYLCVKFK